MEKQLCVDSNADSHGPIGPPETQIRERIHISCHARGIARLHWSILPLHKRHEIVMANILRHQSF
eukprot:scaffold1347_cov350-Pavlova_lutheri.AAC.10